MTKDMFLRSFYQNLGGLVASNGLLYMAFYNLNSVLNILTIGPNNRAEALLIYVIIAVMLAGSAGFFLSYRNLKMNVEKFTDSTGHAN